MVPILAVSCLLVALAGAQTPQEIAFSVGLTHHQLLAGGKDIVFDRVMTNVGSAYDANSGKFTCPVAGVYVFQFHALSRQSAQLSLDLYHNSNYVESAFGHNAADYAAGGNSVILSLNKGDTVEVRAAKGVPSNLYGAGDEVYTTFSGFLIST